MEKIDFKQTVVKNRLGLQKFENFEGSWEEYKQYLYQHNALHPELVEKIEQTTVRYHNPNQFVESKTKLLEGA